MGRSLGDSDLKVQEMIKRYAERAKKFSGLTLQQRKDIERRIDEILVDRQPSYERKIRDILKEDAYIEERIILSGLFGLFGLVFKRRIHID